MQVLVVGATGSLGYSTVNKLLQAGHQPRILVRNPKIVEFDSRVEVVVGDAAQAMVEVGLADNTDGETFHVPGYSPITPRQFFTEVARIAGTGSKVKTIHPQLIKFMGLFDEVVREFIDIQHLWSEPILLDGTKYRQRFGQIPQTPYTEGIHRTLAWFAQQLGENNSSARA